MGIEFSAHQVQPGPYEFSSFGPFYFFDRPLYNDIVRLSLIAMAAIIIFSIAAWFFFIREERSFNSEEVAVPQESMTVERVEFAAQDGVKIVGDYYPPIGEIQVMNGASRGVILLHMMPSHRKSWVALAEKLRQTGLPVLAIDLRGHGESQGGPEGYKSFSDSEHQNSRLDVIAAALFLRSKRVDEFHLVGASIGANLALQYLAEHPNARSAILLSPGLDYRGVKTGEAIQKILTGRGVYLVASDDDQYSRDTVNELASRITLDEKHRLKILESGGHGTTIFENHPEFMDELVEWLTKL